jgi:hypothetical protein
VVLVLAELAAVLVEQVLAAAVVFKPAAVEEGQQ